MAVDQSKLEAFTARAVGDIGATMSAVLVYLGERLGLYKALAAVGRRGLTPSQLAQKSGTSERYVREWCLNQAAGGYIEYDPDGPGGGTYWITPEQAAALADEHSPHCIHGAFLIALSMFMDHPKLERAFRQGDGLEWGEHHPALFEGTDRFFRNAYAAHLIPTWIPALDGGEHKLKEGATVADVGCGHGASTIMMARQYPKSRFWGFDSHGPSIEAAKKAAGKAGVTENATFLAASATEFPRPTTGVGGRGLGGYDMVAFFDSLHSMADPVGAGKHVRSALKQDGTWMVVEPLAHDKVAANLTPVGRMYSAVSALVSVPASLAQRGLALGAQAGETKLRETIQRGGFSRVRKATQTAFNLVIEARP